MVITSIYTTSLSAVDIVVEHVLLDINRIPNFMEIKCLVYIHST